MRQGFLLYETDKRKIQENREILARKLQAGKWTRSLGPGSVYTHDADVHVVGHAGILIPKIKLPG